jgi:hypothetical protein
MAQQSGQDRFPRKGGPVYRPAEFATKVCCRRPGCFQEVRTLILGSGGATGSKNTTLKYINVGFARRVFRPLLPGPRPNQ